MSQVKVSVLSGRVAPFADLFSSAINKLPLSQPQWLSKSGLSGDQQADLRHHGGDDRALHLYPLEHYGEWRRRYPDNAQFSQGAFGENLSTAGLTEDLVCVGDVYQLDDAVIQISQPRSPCFKLNYKFHQPDMALTLQISGLAGYLFRVLVPGQVRPQAEMLLLERGWPQLTVHKVAGMFFNDPLNTDFLQRLIECEALSESWKSKVRQRLQTGLVEEWNKRLFGPMRPLPDNALRR